MHDHHHTHNEEDELYGLGHNHAHSHTDHLHSHMKGQSEADKMKELQVLATSFIESFRDAKDKNSYLRLANIPFQKEGKDGLTMNLVDAKITANWQIGTASPAFASRELVYMPFPGEMINERETMTFTYVSFTAREDVDLLILLKEHTA